MHQNNKYTQWLLITTVSITLAILSSAIPIAHADYVTFPIKTGNAPNCVAFDSTNGNIYVANSVSNTVSVISVASKTIINTITVGTNPYGVAFDSTNGNIYVANTGAGTVSVISGASQTVINTITVGTNPYGVAFDSTNGNIYVANTGAGTVSVINGASQTVINTITVGINPYGVAFDSTNGNIYVANTGDKTVSVINGTSKTVTNTITVGNYPYGVAFDSIKGNIYVANTGDKTVSVISGTSKNVTNTITVGNSPNGVAFDSIKGNIYVSDSGDNAVSVISGTSKTVTNTLPVGTNPYGVAFDSINDNIYVANTDDNTVSPIITAVPSSTIPPVLTVPADIATNATSVSGTVVAYTVNATASQGSPIITCMPSSGSTFTVGTTTVSCTAKDMYGNVATKSFKVIVKPMPDTIPPTFTVPPSDQVLFTMDPTGLVVSYSATATDRNNGIIPVTCTPPSGSQFPIGTTTVTCTAKDASGNTATATAKITVNLQISTTLPVLSHPTNITAEATGPSGAVATFTLTATGGQGITTVTCTPPSGSQFPLGTTTVTCTANDQVGHISLPGIFVVSIRDTTPPTITAPPNITVKKIGLYTTVNLGVPTVNDLVDPNPIISNNATSLGFSVGTTKVAWTVTDHSGNSATVIQFVTITLGNDDTSNNGSVSNKISTYTSKDSEWSGEHHHYKHRYNGDG